MPDNELVDQILAIAASTMTDGFNRSIGALRDAKAIDTRRMDRYYCGIGSRYYDLVTEQMDRSIEYARPRIEQMVAAYEHRLVEKGWKPPDD